MTRRGVIAGAGFSPLSVPWHTAFWASDPSWSNPGDGGAVSSWRDGSGNGRTAVQATAAKQPLYRANSVTANGKPVVEFDGIDDFLLTPDFSSIPQPYELVTVFRLRGGAGSRRIGASSTSPLAGSFGSANDNTWYFAFGAVRTGLAAPGSTPLHHGHLVGNGAVSDFLLDGTSVASGNGGTGTIPRIALGAQTDGTGAGPVDIAFFGFIGRLLTEPERSFLRTGSQSFYATA